MSKVIKDALINSLITIFITGLINFIIVFSNADKAIIRIGDIIKISENKYQVVIDITSFRNYNIDNLRIILPQNINLSDIITNKPLQINKLNSNVQGNLGDVLEINRITENQRVSLILPLNQSIDLHNISIDKNNNKIKVLYNDDLSSPILDNLLLVIIEAFCFGILTFGISYYFELIRLKEFRDSKKEIEIHKQEIDYAKTKLLEMKETLNNSSLNSEKVSNEVRELEKENKQIRYESHRLRLLLLSQISDYKKELDFWRDTIRKFVYLNSRKKEDAEKLINSVTENLKTYQTNLKNDVSLDILLHLSKIVDKDSDNLKFNDK